jgi:hypothetical protein
MPLETGGWTISPAVSAVLDRWIDEQPEPKPSRTDAIQLAVIDWLIALGHFSIRELPEGPSQGH